MSKKNKTQQGESLTPSDSTQETVETVKSKEQKAQEDKEAAEREERLKKEEEQKRKKRIFEQRLKKAQEEKLYVPKKGTGKHFHVNIEMVKFSGSGEKISEPTVQLMELDTFNQWVRSAGRLSLSFALAHDPSAFYTKRQKEELVEALKSYIKVSGVKMIEYGVDNLGLDEKSFINKEIKKMLNKKKEHLAELAKEARKKEDYLA